MKYTTKGLTQYRFYFLLASTYITVQLACVILVSKIMILGPGYLPVSAIIFPLDYCFGDIIAEVYGYKLARQIIWLNVFSQYLFALLITTGIHLPSPSFWHNQAAYNTVVGSVLRIAFSSTLAGVTSAFINAYIISKTKIFMQGKKFWLRCIVASSISEGILVFISYLSIFANVYSLEKILTSILTAWLVKIAASIALIIPATLLVHFLKKAEGIDIYDIYTNFNPFRFRDIIQENETQDSNFIQKTTP